MDLDAAKLRLSSANVLVLDAKEGKAVYAKAADEVGLKISSKLLQLAAPGGDIRGKN